jgi:hypothetical protein
MSIKVDFDISLELGIAPSFPPCLILLGTCRKFKREGWRQNRHPRPHRSWWLDAPTLADSVWMWRPLPTDHLWMCGLDQSYENSGEGRVREWWTLELEVISSSSKGCHTLDYSVEANSFPWREFGFSAELLSFCLTKLTVRVCEGFFSLASFWRRRRPVLGSFARSCSFLH